mgnify:FL=1
MHAQAFAAAGTIQEQPEVDTRTLSLGQSLARFAPHLLALVFPLNALCFTLTGPHRGWVAPLFILPIILCSFLDAKSASTTRPPALHIARWPFNALLLLLVALQLGNLVLLARMIAQTGAWISWDGVVGMIVVGSSSAYSGIVVAHELIHRPGKGWQSLGRILLMSVLYEHFFTEHIRGHHVRVGTHEDPATARFGETFNQFYFRTVPAQFFSAWQLEQSRLAHPAWYQPRLWRNRVLQGVVIELTAVVAVGLGFGFGALITHLTQAWWAARALEVVNYFEHWGIERRGKRVLPVHSWDTHSRFTYYALTGLSRHADHHAFASRPYDQLRVWQQSPKLPSGYLGMFPLVLARNGRFRELMTAELKRKRLGPFEQ